MPGRTLRIIISGGGTGGHIYPAIAIADAIGKQHAAEILFVGAKGRMEMQKVPEAGYAIVGLDIAGLQRSLTLKNLLFPWKVFKSLLESRRIIREFKPDIAVGVGGYASGPLLFSASTMGIPTLIQEQNGYAGITNKILSKSAQKICVAYPEMQRYFPVHKIVVTGNPVRASIQLTDALKSEAYHYFGFNANKPVLLIIGGSLGARTLNQSVAQNLETLINAGVQVIWQTGKAGFAEAKKRSNSLNNPNLFTTEFLSRMDLAYNIANVVISRAGALSISELSLLGKPAILVPSPNVAEDHQTKNAQALLKEGAALLVPDNMAAETLIPTALNLLQNFTQQQELSKGILSMARPDAAQHIAAEVLNLIK
jgi:UDP-N-acetylglucosamine--N-acetylmuramyl-(pentapeptide) pyrophosphoryl-undecaprenol N-acetylglucosamine transferase